MFSSDNFPTISEDSPKIAERCNVFYIKRDFLSSSSQALAAISHLLDPACTCHKRWILWYNRSAIDLVLYILIWPDRECTIDLVSLSSSSSLPVISSVIMAQFLHFFSIYPLLFVSVCSCVIVRFTDSWSDSYSVESISLESWLYVISHPLCSFAVKEALLLC